MATPVTFAKFLELHLNAMRRAPFDTSNDVADRDMRVRSFQSSAQRRAAASSWTLRLGLCAHAKALSSDAAYFQQAIQRRDHGRDHDLIVHGKKLP